MTSRPKALAGLFLLTLVTRSWAAALVMPHVDWTVGDIAEYGGAARALFTDAPAEAWTVREPGYPLLLRAAYTLPGSDAVGVAGLQVLLGALGAVVVVILLRGLLPEAVVWVAGTWVAVSPGLVWLASRPLRGSIVFPLFALFALALARGIVRRRRGDLVLAGGALLLLVHTDARFLVITAVVPLAVLALDARRRALVRGIVLAVAVFASVVPYCAMATRGAGHPVLLAERTLIKWLPRALGRAERAGPGAAVKPPPADAPSFAVVAGARFVEYWRFARFHPGHLPYPDLREAKPWSWRHNVVGIASVVPILLLAPFAWRGRGSPDRRVLTFLGILLAAHCLLHMAVHARARYRIPAEGLWAIPLAAAVVRRHGPDPGEGR